MRPTMEGVTARRITTGRLSTRVLFSGPEEGTPVVFLHGNMSSATWWEESLVTLPPGYRGIAPDMRGFGDADPQALIDARRGMGDFVDDAVVLLDALGIERAHFVGCSLGGQVLWRLLAERSARVLSATMVAPGPPFGFGGTKDLDGTPCFPDFAGSGAGLMNPILMRGLVEGDRSCDSPFSPRSALRSLVFGRGFVPEREEALLEATLATHMGDRSLPGDKARSVNWPYVAPGEWGSANAASPKYAGDVDDLLRAPRKVSVLWVRGSADVAIADGAASDPATLGKVGRIPNWPGPAVCPPQPMLGQTRKVLERYRDAGGTFEEVVIDGAGHVPFLQKPQAFNEALHGHLGQWES